MYSKVLVFLVAAGTCAALFAQEQGSGQKTLAATLGVAVFPADGQTAQVQSTHEAECYKWAVDNTEVDPFTAEKQVAAAQQQAAQQQQQVQQGTQGSGAKGAVKGAAAGALIGEIANNDADEGAAYGAAVGAIAGRRSAKRAQAQAEQQSQQSVQQAQAVSAEQKETFRKSFSVCLEAKKYLVKY
jgi:hypothetical protein